MALPKKSSNKKTKYVVGFLFNNIANHYYISHEGSVGLILKNRPAWQAGKINGIGGHVEKDEGLHVAMRREFLEETGVDIPDWEYRIRYEGSDFMLCIFSSFSDLVFNLTTMEDEEIQVHHIKDVFKKGNIIYNLNWIIPLLLDPHIGGVNRIYEKHND